MCPASEAPGPFPSDPSAAAAVTAPPILHRSETVAAPGGFFQRENPDSGPQTDPHSKRRRPYPGTDS